MPKIVVIHNVVDVDEWLQFKSERPDAIVAMGGSNVVVTWHRTEATPWR